MSEVSTPPFSISAFLDLRELFHQLVGIDDHSCIGESLTTVFEYPARNKVEFERTFVVDDGMSGIVAALEAYDHIHIFGKIIHYFTFAFVSELCSDKNCNRHIVPP